MCSTKRVAAHQQLAQFAPLREPAGENLGGVDQPIVELGRIVRTIPPRASMLKSEQRGQPVSDR